MTYTTKPSTLWEGYSDVLEHGQYRGCCKTSEIDAYIQQIEQASNDHWQHVLDRSDDPRSVRADGHSYWIGADTDSPRGFGGQRWLITFLDGSTVECRSLWHNGVIPRTWRIQLPDNATLRAI
jgi:hypothetical protein